MASVRCPECGAELSSHPGGGGGHRPGCGRTNPRDLPRATRIRPPSPPPPERRTRYARYWAEPGEVVGLEKVSEQYVEGDGFIQGSLSVSGYYDDPHRRYPGGSVSPAVGRLSGGGSLFGTSSIRTQYAYETRFFLRGAGRVDRPFRFPGVSYLPVLEGHAVSAVWCENDRGRRLLLALVNHDTRPAVLPVATRDRVIDHLGIPPTRRVRQVLVGPEQHEELLAEQEAEERAARDRHERQLARKRRTRRRYAPSLLGTAALSFAVVVMGLLVWGRGGHAAAGLVMLAVGGAAFLAGIGGLAYVCLDELWHPARPDVGPPEPIRTHRTVTVPNEEFEEELRAIRDFIAEVAQAGRPGRS